MFEKRKDYILSNCSKRLKKDMEISLNKFPFPDVFQTGLRSSQFKKDLVAEKKVWYEELQFELWSILYDSHDIELNYI